MMQLFLRAVHGTLQKPGGKPAGAGERSSSEEVPITGRTFLLGTAADCHLRCAGRSISPHHCLIAVEPDRIVVRDCRSRDGTLVNGQRIDSTACLFPGDRLQIGKLEFEVVFRKESELETVPDVQPVASVDTVADLVVDLLTTEDEAERARMRHDPAARLFRPDQPSPIHSDEASNQRGKGIPEAVLAASRRPPSKLPPPPDIRGEDTVDAANQALSHLFASSPAKRESKKRPSDS